MAANAFEFANWEQLQQLLQLYQQYYFASQGYDIEEVMKIVGSSGVAGFTGEQIASTALATVNTAKNFVPTATEYVAGTALEAFESYESAGGLITKTGGAVAVEGAVDSVANIGFGTIAGESAALGLLSMSPPAVLCAIAPLFGVAIGSSLYNLNPEFWTKASQQLLPFAYKDTGLIPAYVDSEGNTYFSEEMIEALRGLLENSGEHFEYPAYSNSGDVTITSLSDARAIFYSLLAKHYNGIEFRGNTQEYLDNFFNTYTDCKIDITITRFPNGSYSRFHPIRVYPNYNVNDTIYLPGRYSNGGLLSISLDVDENGKAILSDPDYDPYHTFYYGVVGEKDIVDSLNQPATEASNANATYFPPEEGVDTWEGEKYPSNTKDAEIAVGKDEEGEVLKKKYKPVALPLGMPPTATNTPSVNPSPVANPVGVPAAEPWIKPQPSPQTYPATIPQDLPAPLPNPTPVPVPAPSGDINPSNPVTTPPSNPPEASVPSSEGIAPVPVLPIIPPIQGNATGLIHVYNPTESEIQNFGAWLWNTFSGDLIETLSKLFNNPMDAVIGVHELYATPSTGSAQNIRAGYLVCDEVSSKVVTERYTEINCGNIIVQEYFSNYLDYEPYTEVLVYLPFIGICRLNANDIIGASVNITYKVDSYTGCCIALITTAKKGYSSTAYQFEGNCAVEIPITSGYHSVLMGAMLGTAVAGVTGNIGAGILASNVGNASLGGVNRVEHSGSFGASYGAMGIKKPYLIIRRPVQKVVNNYNYLYGFPAHKLVNIGNCSGYIRVLEVDVQSSTATDEEKNMIVNLLKEGIYV